MPVKIISVEKDSPAEMAGILPGKHLRPLIPMKLMIFSIIAFMKQADIYPLN